MQNPESQKIVVRFFEALNALVSNKVIRGKKTFTDRYEINRWNLNSLSKNPESDRFQVSWLTILVDDFGVSASWLLTGNGEMFTKKQNDNKKVRAIPPRSRERKARREAPISSEVES